MTRKEEQNIHISAHLIVLSSGVSLLAGSLNVLTTAIAPEPPSCTSPSLSGSVGGQPVPPSSQVPKGTQFRE
mgnify:CR=1 FL=1